ncbi:MAG: GHKL domain-containing protein [Lachnospiraceae bacterium]|nr:GHKL domain-containing protein [Lachnospiraceae bacterium]
MQASMKILADSFTISFRQTIGVTDAAIEILTDSLICIMVLFAGKTLYEESIVIDRITWIIMVIMVGVRGLGTILQWNDFAMLFLYFSTYLICFLRGNSTRWYKRLVSFLQLLISVISSLVTFSEIVMWLINPELCVVYMQEGTVGIAEYTLSIVISVLCIGYLYFRLYRKGISLPFRGVERGVLIVFSIYITSLSLFAQETISDGRMQHMGREFRGFFLITIVLMYLFFPIVLVKNKMSDYYKKQQEYQQEWIALELQHFAEYKEAQEDTRKFRHDIVNNLTCIQSLMGEERYPQAQRYVDDLLGQVQELSPKVVTGDEMLDCILSFKWEKMKKSQIAFFVDGVLDRGLDWKQVDICTVFANGVDNAIEACMQLEEHQDRWIRLNLRRTSNFYYVELSNAISESMQKLEFTRGFTTKKNKQIHGYGLANMKNTLEKYGGTMNIAIERGIFHLKMTIPQ